MKHLQQAMYEDDNGHPFPAEKVDCLAPYTHIVDGFYNWSCGSCGKEHGDRWWHISGRVLQCGECKKWNLLVRTNCTEISTALSDMWRQPEVMKENERLKDVVKWNDEQMKKIRADVMNTVEIALTDARRKLGI